MTDFTASNGAKVDVYTKSLSLETSGDVQDWIEPWAVDALREFFQHERDEELGRWRWPENPNYVVYRSTFDPDYLYVLNEDTADVFGLDGIEGEHNDESVDDDFAVFAADAFRQEHPVNKPWEEAKPGEVWEINGFPAWRLESGAFMFDDESFLFTEDITSGRRIWPEDAS